MADKQFGSKGFVALPPDSTGKNLLTDTLVLVDYISGTIDFNLGDTVTGSTSGATAEVVQLTGSTSTGTLRMVLEDNTPAVTFTVGENLQVNAITNAVVSDQELMNSQTVSIVGANNPLNSVFVDEQGAAFIRFAEGQQQMDAAGMSRQTSPTQLSQYTFFYDEDTVQWFTDINGTASISHLADESAVALDVDTANADRVTRTTHRYHLYQQGFGQQSILSIACGDSGKTNVTRRWGYFDDDNGLFFELSGTNLSVVKRSSTTGSVVDTSVLQSNWNVDKLDGSGGVGNLSRMNIDPSQMNLYWMDFYWLGSGRSRFGVFSDNGARIVIHTFQTANVNTQPAFGKPNLPLRVEIFNTGVSGSPSRIKMVGGTTHTEGNVVPARSRKTVKWSVGNTGDTTVGGTVTPIISLRSKLTINGIVNRRISIPELLGVHILTEPMLICLVRNGSLSGESWASVSSLSAAEWDESATSITGGDPLVHWMFSPGQQNLTFPENFGIFSENLIIAADGTAGDIFTFTAESLTGSNGDVRLFQTWIDVG